MQGGGSGGADASQPLPRSTLMDATNASRPSYDVKGGGGGTLPGLSEGSIFGPAKTSDTPSQRRSSRRTTARQRLATQPTPAKNLNASLQAAATELPTQTATPARLDQNAQAISQQTEGSTSSRPSSNSTATTPPTVTMDWSPGPESIAADTPHHTQTPVKPQTPATLNTLKGVDLNMPYPGTAPPAQRAAASAFFTTVKAPAVAATSIKTNTHEALFNTSSSFLNPVQLDSLFSMTAGATCPQQGANGMNPSGTASKTEGGGWTTSAGDSTTMNGSPTTTSSTTMNGTSTPGKKHRSASKSKSAVNYNDLGLSAGLRSSAELKASLNGFGAGSLFSTSTPPQDTRPVFVNLPARSLPIAEEFNRAASTRLPSSDSEEDVTVQTVAQRVPGSYADTPVLESVSYTPSSVHRHARNDSLVSQTMSTPGQATQGAPSFIASKLAAPTTNARAQLGNASELPGMLTPRESKSRTVSGVDQMASVGLVTPQGEQPSAGGTARTRADAAGMSPLDGTPAAGGAPSATPASTRKTHLRAVRKGKKSTAGEDSVVKEALEVRLSQSGLKLFDDSVKRERATGSIPFRLNPLVVDLTDLSGPSTDPLGTSRTVESRPVDFNSFTPRGSTRSTEDSPTPRGPTGAATADIPHWMKNTAANLDTARTTSTQPSAFFPSAGATHSASSAAPSSTISNITSFTDPSTAASSVMTAGFHTAANDSPSTATTSSTGTHGARFQPPASPVPTIPFTSSQLTSSPNLPPQLVAAAAVPLPVETTHPDGFPSPGSVASGQLATQAPGSTPVVNFTSAINAATQPGTAAPPAFNSTQPSHPCTTASATPAAPEPAATGIYPTQQSGVPLGAQHTFLANTAPAAQAAASTHRAGMGGSAPGGRRPVPTLVGWQGIGLRNEDEVPLASGASSTRSEATSATPKKANTGKGSSSSREGARYGSLGSTTEPRPAAAAAWQPGDISFALGSTPQRAKPSAPDSTLPAKPHPVTTHPSTGFGSTSSFVFAPSKQAVPRFNDPSPAAAQATPAFSSTPTPAQAVGNTSTVPPSFSNTPVPSQALNNTPISAQAFSNTPISAQTFNNTHIGPQAFTDAPILRPAFSSTPIPPPAFTTTTTNPPPALSNITIPSAFSAAASGPSSTSSSVSTFSFSAPAASAPNSVPASPPEPPVQTTVYSIPETTPTVPKSSVPRDWATPLGGNWSNNVLFGASSSDSSPASRFTSPANLTASKVYPNPFSQSFNTTQRSNTPAIPTVSTQATVQPTNAPSLPSATTQVIGLPPNTASLPAASQATGQPSLNKDLTGVDLNSQPAPPPSFKFTMSSFVPLNQPSSSNPFSTSTASTNLTTSAADSSTRADSSMSNTPAEATVFNQTPIQIKFDHSRPGDGSQKAAYGSSRTSRDVSSSMDAPPAKMAHRWTEPPSVPSPQSDQQRTNPSGGEPTGAMPPEAAPSAEDVIAGMPRTSSSSAAAAAAPVSASEADAAVGVGAGMGLRSTSSSSAAEAGAPVFGSSAQPPPPASLPQGPADGGSNGNITGSAFFGGSSSTSSNGSSMVGKGAKAPKVPSLNLEDVWMANTSAAKFTAGVEAKFTPRASATPRSTRGKDRSSSSRRTYSTTPSIPFNLTPSTFGAASTNPLPSQSSAHSASTAPSTTTTDPVLSKTTEQMEKLNIQPGSKPLGPDTHQNKEANAAENTPATAVETPSPATAVETPSPGGPVPFTPSPIPFTPGQAAQFTFSTTTKPGSSFFQPFTTPFSFRLDKTFATAGEVQATPNERIFTGGDHPKNMTSPIDVHMAGSTPEHTANTNAGGSTHEAHNGPSTNSVAFGGVNWGSAVQFGATDVAGKSGTRQHDRAGPFQSSAQTRHFTATPNGTASSKAHTMHGNAAHGFGVAVGANGKPAGSVGSSPTFEFSAMPNKEEKSLKQAVEKARTTSGMFKTRANYNYQAKNYGEAESDYGKAIQEFEQLPPPGQEAVRCDLAVLRSNRAGARLMLGRVKEALQDSLCSTQLDPTFPRAYGRAITCHVRLGDVDDAIALLGEALKNLNTPSSKQELGEKKEELRGLQKMKQKLLESVTLDMTQEQVNKLLEESKAAFEKMSDCPALHIVRAALQLRCAQYPAVLSCCRDARTVPWQWWMTLQVKYLEGDLLEALKVAEQGSALLASADSSALDPTQLGGVKLPSQQELNSLTAHMKELMLLKNQGNEAVGAKQWQQAVDKYTSAIVMQPPLAFSAVLHCNRAVAQSNLEKHVEALADAGRAKALNPLYAKAYSRLASFLAEMKRADVAVATLESMIETCGAGMDAAEKGTVQERLHEHRAKAKREKTPNHYQFLDLQKTCSEDDVRRAYKKMALRYHPDKALSSCKFGLQLGDSGLRLVTGGEVEQRLHKEASCLFSYIGQAHEELSDKARRRKVDMSLSAENDLADTFAASCSFNPHNPGYQTRAPSNYYTYSQNSTRNPYGGTSYYSTNHSTSRPSYHDPGYGAGYATRTARPSRPAAAPHRPSGSGGYGTSTTNGPTRFTTSTGSGSWWNSPYGDDDDDEWESDEDRWG